MAAATLAKLDTGRWPDADGSISIASPPHLAAHLIMLAADDLHARDVLAIAAVLYVALLHSADRCR